MRRRIIPDVVKYHGISMLSEADSAFAASMKMMEANVAAIVVNGEDGKIKGIVTERDLTRRVMAKDFDPKDVTLAEIMTRDPDTLAPADTARDALELMRTRSYRHLPVVEDGCVVAMVSVRDLYSAIKKDLEEDIRETEAFVFGDRYTA